MARPNAPVILRDAGGLRCAEPGDVYKDTLGATELWNLGSVIGLDIAGAPFPPREA